MATTGQSCPKSATLVITELHPEPPQEDHRVCTECHQVVPVETRIDRALPGVSAGRDLVYATHAYTPPAHALHVVGPNMSDQQCAIAGCPYPPVVRLAPHGNQSEPKAPYCRGHVHQLALAFVQVLDRTTRGAFHIPALDVGA